MRHDLNIRASLQWYYFAAGIAFHFYWDNYPPESYVLAALGALLWIWVAGSTMALVNILILMAMERFKRK